MCHNAWQSDNNWEPDTSDKCQGKLPCFTWHGENLSKNFGLVIEYCLCNRLQRFNWYEQILLGEWEIILSFIGVVPLYGCELTYFFHFSATTSWFVLWKHQEMCNKTGRFGITPHYCVTEEVHCNILTRNCCHRERKYLQCS